MPTRTFTFIQPYDAVIPDPTRHEWIFSPIAPDGRGPAQEASAATANVLATGQLCEAESVRQWCLNDLTEVSPFGFTINPTIDQMNECILNNSYRCTTSSTTYEPGDGWILVRACGDVGISCSEWSPGLPVPEPGVSLALLVGSLALVAIARLRSLRG
jgi:hypothetical protein